MKIFTVIYYKMPIPCNNMVNSIENAHIKGSCGILWYPAVSCGNQTDPPSTYEFLKDFAKIFLNIVVTLRQGGGDLIFQKIS